MKKSIIVLSCVCVLLSIASIAEAKLPCIREKSTSLPKEVLYTHLKKNWLASGAHQVQEDPLVLSWGREKYYFNLVDGVLYWKVVMMTIAPTYYSSYFSTVFNQLPEEKDTTCAYIHRRNMPKFIEDLDKVEKEWKEKQNSTVITETNP